MKKLLLFFFVVCAGKSFSQDINVLLKQGVNYERVLKEDSAILKYKEVLATSAENVQSLIKISILTTAAGARQADKQTQKQYFENAKSYADKALAVDSSNIDAIYAKGFALFKMIGTEQENKKVAALEKEVYVCASKALSINPNHGRANFLMGKWNVDLVTTAWTKKAALNVLYGGIPDASIENALLYMEKCRTAEPYFLQNFLELAKAYKFNNNPSKAIEVLNQLVKLPYRTADDKGWKEEAKKILSELQ